MNRVAPGIPLLFLSALFLSAQCVGCAPALPLASSEAGIVGHESEKAALALEETKAALAEIQSQVKHNEKLLSEARSILKQVRASEESCRAVVAKIPKKPKVVYIEKPVPVVEGEGVQAPAGAPAHGGAASPPPAPPPPPSSAGYSRSDAPDGVYVPRGAGVSTTTSTTVLAPPVAATLPPAQAPRHDSGHAPEAQDGHGH